MMAKVKLNPVLEQLRGQVGELVFKRYGDDVVVARKPDVSGKERSAAQLAVQERFRFATLYGKMVMADADTRALYEKRAKQKGMPLFSLMITDYLHAPLVNEIDLTGYHGSAGDEIIILASDDFEVVAVQVTLSDGPGSLIESGAALETPTHSGRWVYHTTAEVSAGTLVRIGVSVRDRPGGEASAEAEKTL